jgi:hypothetical protein
MKIEDVGLKFPKALTPLKRVDKIIVHHPAHPTWDIKDIHNAHINGRGFNGIGYNYFVTQDGRVQKGRGRNQGAHCLNGWNSKSLGISFQGNFEIQTPTEVQYRAGAELIAQLILDEGLNIHDVDGHKKFDATVCPGKNFDLNKLRNYVLECMNPKAKVEQATSVKIQTGGLTAEMVKEVSEYFIEKKWWSQVQFTSDGKNPTVLTGGLDPGMQKEFEAWLDKRGWYHNNGCLRGRF